MKKKFIKFKCLFLILLIISINFSMFTEKKVYAFGALETYMNEASAKECSDVALKDLLGQTGYKVGSQAEIDAIRSKAILETPVLTSKYPLIFGASGDKLLDPYHTYTEEELARFHETGFEAITRLSLDVGADLRKWVNDTIDAFKTEPTINVDGSPVTFTWSTSQYITISGNMGIPTGFLYTPGTVLTSTNVEQPLGSGFSTHTYWDLWDSKGVQIWDDNEFGGEPFTFSSPPVDEQAIEDEKFKDYLPYPTKEFEIGTQKVPTEIAIPVKVGDDGKVTPIVPPSPFPTTKVAPDADGLVNTGTSIITYTTPTIDPSTGEVVDPIVTPEVPVVPETGFPSIDVPKSDIPTLNFKPLMIATMKFPFCVPWDLWSTYKVFDGGSTPFNYRFDEISINGSITNNQNFVIIPSFKLDFADYPIVDDGIKVFRYLMLLGFIVFIILQTRKLIRG